MFLVDDNRHAQVFDGVGIWLGVAWQEVAHKGAEGLVELAPRFRRHSVKHDGGFPRAGHTSKDSDFALRNAQRYILQVVFTGAAYLDVFLGHNSLLACYIIWSARFRGNIPMEHRAGRSAALPRALRPARWPRGRLRFQGSLS